jgi:transaldolase
MNAWKRLAAFGQSLWYDNISRGFIERGGLQEMIATYDLKGVTSNPSIFEKAISNGSEYDDDIRSLIEQGKSTHEIYEKLTTDDIRVACDILYDVYVATGGVDGYVSIEVDPTLAHTTDETLAEARKLWNIVDRPNVMIKIPGTPKGLPAVRAAIAEGINVNITLLFGIGNYTDVAHAYIAGLQDRLARGEALSKVHSVASFFLSRVDTSVDKLLLTKGDEYAHLLGKAAVANAKLAYERFHEIFNSKEFDQLRASGASVQRCLWASVSTKNPSYNDVMYIEPLIGTETVTTVPDETITAFADHGKAESTLDSDIKNAHMVIDSLKAVGIDTEAVAEELQIDGVKKFEDAFKNLLLVLAKKQKQVEITA